MHALSRLEITGSPPPWSVTSVDKFVVTALQRAQREGGALPDDFYLTLCPWGERNAIGGTPVQVQEVTDPRFRIVHFTGCSRPYLVAILIGEDAAEQQQVAIKHLPWSEHYGVEMRNGTVRLRFIAYTEDPEEESEERAGARTLQDLFRTGEHAEL